VNGYLLDSTVIIDWLRGHPVVTRWLSVRAAAGARLVLSPITVAEVMAGVAPGLRQRRREELGAFDFAPLEFEAAALAGETYADLSARGRRLPLPDLLQGAQARTLGLILATSNLAHFPDLEVEDPRLQPG